MRLRELVYADDICLLASLPEQEQALIDAFAAYCATLRIKTSVPTTKVMVVSAAAVDFTCNGNLVEQVANFKSKQRVVAVGRVFSGVIHCCSLAIPSTCSCICCKLSWCLSYKMTFSFYGQN